MQAVPALEAEVRTEGAVAAEVEGRTMESNTRSCAASGWAPESDVLCRWSNPLAAAVGIAALSSSPRAAASSHRRPGLLFRRMVEKVATETL